MKELYTSPEMKINCFAPAERLASEEGQGIAFQDLLKGMGDTVISNGDDVNVEINLSL